ncbi:CDP-diacylglycerol--serine O-phosphatidyltransferase [Desulfacinum hydrothermale DSM 13146]|uniref:CDP-diacylglycerol--serine O-phosphatidyltransferase n=1 Tax=Desulfacinum hydrothermale DSM 13146 TaxID=1121390 RepID=A0A1W1XJD3_9BACT|nr:CDP-diacylglycerol--serine O-phosphatidyltransferase [Desulfacinum hydrothermale]SMC24079.1 CDP-diacylglycerol--serine O-phosphatidyltransferase [Desulfacinum hydrothermale DSM 13146]
MSHSMNTNRNPARKKKRKRRNPEEETSRGTYILPNLFTTGNLFAGFYGIVSSINGHYFHAAVAILVSCVFDILDGKVARFAKATSRFGIEYDSLADLVAFGVGPALLIYLWALQPFGRLGWLAGFVFVACGALRLARFNVQAGQGPSNYFVGLPIPGAACMIATTVLFLFKIKGQSYNPTLVIFLLEAYVLGFLMVSNIPFNSFKEMEVIKGKPLPALFVLVLLLTVVAAKPPVMLFLMFSAYVLSGPVTYLVKRFRKKRALETDDEGVAEGHSPPAGLHSQS